MPLSAEDQLAITKLYADYNHTIDGGEADAWAALFAPDAVFHSGFEEVRGHDSLVAFAAATHEMLPGGRHVISNLSLDGDGDEAHGRCYLQMWNTQGGAGSTSLVITGRYTDELRRHGGAWRFAGRSMTPDN